MNVKAGHDVKPVRNEHDYQNAKSKIEKLMIAVSQGDVQSSDELEILVALVESYERRSFPKRPQSPIDAIKFRLSQKGLSQKDLEPFIGSRSRISDVLSGTRKLSPDMMRALHEGLAIPYEALMQKEEPYKGAGIEVKKPILKKMKDLGFDISSHKVEYFIHRAFGGGLSPALNRRTRTQRASGRTDDTALLMWQASVLTEARLREKSLFKRAAINRDTLREVSQLSSKPEGPKEAIQMLSEIGVTVIILPVFPGTFLDGAAMLIDNSHPVIGMTLRHDKTDNFWFTLLHELSHLLLHYDMLLAPGQAFFDELDLGAGDEVEQEADDMALMSLIPKECARPLYNSYASNNDIISVSECAGVHPSIAAGRWQKEHNNYKKFSRIIERNKLRELLL
ncbi:helix-turn-helix domain-containing protein [Frigidibacter sp. MR17.14]|uniref:helix-turn-helix domain-containing protein n=1 Tax=Frigidibacter sp. MR17.14 TaxID=3126509 RepID=UPI003012C4ED